MLGRVNSSQGRCFRCTTVGCDNLQATLLRYTLPAMACAPPLLLSLVRQSSARGVLLTCHVLVSPSMPGSLEAVTLDLHLPSSSQAPLKVPPGGACVLTS